MSLLLPGLGVSAKVIWLACVLCKVSDVTSSLPVL